MECDDEASEEREVVPRGDRSHCREEADGHEAAHFRTVCSGGNAFDEGIGSVLSLPNKSETEPREENAEGEKNAERPASLPSENLGRGVAKQLFIHLLRGGGEDLFGRLRRVEPGSIEHVV